MIKKTVAITILFFTILSFASYLFDREFENLKEEELIQKVAKVHRVFDQRVEQKRQDLNYYLQEILQNKELLDALKYEQREKIDTIVSPYYNVISRVDASIKLLTFRTKEGITLYRAHEKEFYGDSLDKKRTIILDTDKQQRSFSGFEVGKLFISYRVTRPIFCKNEYIGNVEIGADPTLMLKDLSAVLDADIGVAAQNRFLEVMNGPNTLYIGDKLFMLQGNRNLENYFSKKSQSKNGYRVDASVDLKNHKLELIGYLIFGFDIHRQFAQYKKEQEKIFWFFAFVLGIFFALFTFMLYERNAQLQKDDKDFLDLTKVLNEKSVTPYFQLIVDADANVVKYEALMRIVYQEGGETKVLLPDVFLKEAIKEEVYISLFQEMIQKSMYRFKDREEMISLNFLPSDLFNIYIMQEFVQNIKMFDTPQRVVVEISEVECAKNFSKVLQVAKKLKGLGVGICIDNFDGTSLNYSTLLAINPHSIKINGTLLATRGAVGYEQLYSMLQFAKENNIKVATDFVADKEMFELLKTYGIEEFQGYYFGEPKKFLEEK
ncbi:MAG: EAL domain-containing protein [Sulfurimonas sp.]|uniref:EAL domain-containing protein n=1 Tax=Sulfurimonas sp. TaxID=2022749 RepID=UPI002628D4FE|nr:EAL domain-containing protein [Sulfurimonas sp.]MDD2652167.1 EAL domain-containing protein [Sulfurimonas sp.]MDD3450550.1 EAL domain-containing protein [Sulfurimonas sp.]